MIYDTLVSFCSITLSILLSQPYIKLFQIKKLVVSLIECFFKTCEVFLMSIEESSKGWGVSSYHHSTGDFC